MQCLGCLVRTGEGTTFCRCGKLLGDTTQLEGKKATFGRGKGAFTHARSHFGSRAFSVQVNIVAVSAHVFHSSLLVSCSMCLHIFAFSRSLSLGLMSQSRVVDASDRPVPNSPVQFTSSNFGFPNGSGSDLDGIGTRPGITADEKLDALLSKFVHFEMQIAQIPTLTNWMSRVDSLITKHSEILRLDLQRWNIISAPSAHDCAKSKHMQPQHPLYPVRHDPGPRSNKLMAPQPQGPMAQGHLTTTGTQDADLILSQALMMNMHEVPSYYSFHVNNTTLEFLIGSLTSGQRPLYLPTTNPSGIIAIQVAYPPDLYSRRELNVRTLWPETKIMVSPTKLIVHFVTTEPISQSASPSHLKTEKSENDLRLCGKLWPTSSKISSLKETRQAPSLFLHSTYDHKCSALRIAGTVCDKSFCKPVLRLRMARPMCDGRPFASSPFCRLASRGPSLRGFLYG